MQTTKYKVQQQHKSPKHNHIKQMNQKHINDMNEKTKRSQTNATKNPTKKHTQTHNKTYMMINGPYPPVDSLNSMRGLTGDSYFFASYSSYFPHPHHHNPLTHHPLHPSSPSPSMVLQKRNAGER